MSLQRRGEGCITHARRHGGGNKAPWKDREEVTLVKEIVEDFVEDVIVKPVAMAVKVE